MIRKIPKEVALSSWTILSLFPLLTAEEVKVYIYIATMMARVDDYFLLSSVRMWEGSVDKNGDRVDYGTGLPRKEVFRALAALAEYGVITTERAGVAREIEFKIPKRTRLGTSKTIDLEGLKARAKVIVDKRFARADRMGTNAIVPRDYSLIDAISLDGAPGHEAEQFLEERGWGDMGQQDYFGMPDPRRDPTPPELREARKMGLSDIQFRELVDWFLDATKSTALANINIDVSFANRALKLAQEAAYVAIVSGYKTVAELDTVLEKWNSSWMAEKRRREGQSDVPSFGDLTNQLRLMPPRVEAPTTPRPVVRLDDTPNVMLPPKKQRGGPQK